MLSAGSAAGKKSQDFSSNTSDIPPETQKAVAGSVLKAIAGPAIEVSTAAAPMADQKSSQNNVEQLVSIDDVMKGG